MRSAGIALMSLPAICTVPAAGSISRISILISVDLPQPVGPMMNANSPRRDLEREVLEGDVAARVDDGRVVDADDRRLAGGLARGRASRAAAAVLAGVAVTAFCSICV